MRMGLLAAAMGAALLLEGCGVGGSMSTTSTTTWPPTTLPTTTQTNTYVGTQNPGLYTVTIDHTNNSFSYQDLSTSSAAVSGTFTTTANGFLVLSTANGPTGYALEQLSRAVLLVPSTISTGNIPITDNSIFAVAAPACQTVPTRTEFEYLAMPQTAYDNASPNEHDVGSGLLDISSSNNGQDWQFGGEVQYVMPAGTLTPPGISFDPTPDPISGTCAANSQNSSVIATSITAPSSLAANFAIGPTGFFMEDRYQSDGLAFVGAVEPTSPIDLSQLSGSTFLGVESTVSYTSLGAPNLTSFSASADSSGTSEQLAGGVFPMNNPASTPGANVVIDLGTQDPTNNGYFPSATVTFSGSTSGMGFQAGVPNPAYAIVSNAGGKYSIFALVGNNQPYLLGLVLFQQ